MSIINRETDYALRILRSLSKGKETTVSMVCEEQSMAKPFVYKIAKKLANAGIIEITRGKSGGIKLIKNLNEVSLYDIFHALDSVQYVNECLRPGYECEYAKKGQSCNIHTTLVDLQEHIDAQFKSSLISDYL